MGFSRFKANVERGMEGANEGLPIDMPALENFVPNLQRKHYYLVGGNTGSGKTTFMMDKLCLTPLEHVANLQATPQLNTNNIDVAGLFYSLEVDETSIIAKAVSRKIYKDYGRALPVNYILSRGKNRISQEDYDLVMMYSDYWDFISEKIKFTDVPKTAEEIKNDIHKLAITHGKLMTSEDGQFSHYEPNNPNMYLPVWIDHLALLELSKQHNGKILQAMEELSHVLIRARNTYHITAVVIQQLNMDVFDPTRVKIGRLAPTLADFGDSKKISRDAEVVMALHNPMMFSQQAYAGYNIDILRDNFRSVEVLKNRYGECNKKVGCFFNGAAGLMKELPNPTGPEIKEVYRRLLELRKA